MQKPYGWNGFSYGNVCEEKLPDLLRRYNLKLKKKKTLDDVKLALGRAFKNTPCVSSKQIERIAEEIDKVCTIANWEEQLQNIRHK